MAISWWEALAAMRTKCKGYRGATGRQGSSSRDFLSPELDLAPYCLLYHVPKSQPMSCSGRTDFRISIIYKETNERALPGWAWPRQNP